MTTSVCGDLLPCATYLTSNPFDVPINVINSWTLQLISGYNKLYLPQSITVNKGSFLYLIQNTGSVAVDQSGSQYSDLVWNNVTFWTKLNYNSNWRFYLTTINSFTSYQNSFILSHVYSSIGSYNMSITFLSSYQTFLEIVNVTDCMIYFNLILILITF